MYERLKNINMSTVMSVITKSCVTEGGITLVRWFDDQFGKTSGGVKSKDKQIFVSDETGMESN